MSSLGGDGNGQEGMITSRMRDDVSGREPRIGEQEKHAAGKKWTTNFTLMARNRTQGLLSASTRSFTKILQGLQGFQSTRNEVELKQFFIDHPVSINMRRCANSLARCTRDGGLPSPESLSRLLSHVMIQTGVLRRAARPALATLSSSFWPAASTENVTNDVRVARHLFDLAMSGPQVAKSMDRVPVYTVSNASNEFVLLMDLGGRKSLGIFCFRQQDADALLAQVKHREPSMGRGARVVQVMLDKVYQLKAEGIGFRFLPDPQQVRHALEERGRKGTEPADRGFDGIPVFQSGNLILKTRNRRFLPVFFSKEDLDLALRKAFQQQKRSNPALKVNTDIQVASFENIVKQMESKGEESGWGDVVFIPPGTDVNNHLETAVAWAEGPPPSMVC